jgi:pilus assembly protein CpaF
MSDSSTPFWNEVQPDNLGFLGTDDPSSSSKDPETSLDAIFAETSPAPKPPPPPPWQPPTASPTLPASASPTDDEYQSRRQSRRQESRDAQRAAAVPISEEEAQVAAARDQFERRMEMLEEFYQDVDSILVMVSDNKDVSKLIATFELTSDLVVDDRQRQAFINAIRPLIDAGQVSLGTPKDIPTVFSLAYDEVLGISIVGDLWRDPTVDEILIDAWNKISVERFGHLYDTGYRFRTPEHADRIARVLSEMVSGRLVSPANPLPTAVLPSARVQFVYGEIVGSGLAIAIRKFRPLMGMNELLEKGSLSEEIREFLIDIVHARATILVSGGVSTGKTTIINALSNYIPNTERVITIEDAFELQLSNHHIVSMQAKSRSRLDDSVAINQEDLLVASLRMRPDRIIVGEVREPLAAATMIQAAVTGHDGTMTTIHASSPQAALNSRMTSLLTRSAAGFTEATARAEVATAFDLVIQIKRTAGQRYIAEIALVDPTLIVNNRIEPLPLFTGHMADITRPVEYRRVNALPSDSVLAGKLHDAGIDASRWLVL